jgi:ABC-type antimicrobial peptide transport system permease subunit
MPLLVKARSFLRNLFSSRHVDADLDLEVHFYLEMLTEEKIRAGMSRSEAQRAACIELGGIEQVKEQVREERVGNWLHSVLSDCRFTLRRLRKSPAFAAVAVLTLALGIGATTAIFSVVYGVLLRPLAYRNAEEIVRLWEQNEWGGRMDFADPNFEDMRSQNHALQGVAEYSFYDQTVVGQGEPSRVMTASVSCDFFQVMGVQPVLGRGFQAEEQRLGAGTAVLVSYAYWKLVLGGTPDLSSVHLKIGSQPASVIGVLPLGFRFPDNTDIWIPREIREKLPSRTAHNWKVIGRLRDGAVLAEARAELAAIAQRLKQEFGQDTMMVAVAVEPLRQAMTSNARPTLVILLCASGFLLVIACANVVNLMLAQAVGRERELCIRTALGAQRSRLIRQFLTESFLFSFLGGALGILLAYWGLNGLLALAPPTLPRLEGVSINLSVLSFSLGTISLVSIGLGILTALRTTLADPWAALAEGGRGPSEARGKQRIGRVIAAGQLAAALALLVGAGLLGRSLLRLLAVGSGFRTEGVLTMTLGLPDDPKKTQRIEFLNQLLAKLREVPGIEEVGGTSDLPLSGSAPSDGYYVLMNPGQISPHRQELIQRIANGSLEKDPVLLGEFTSFFDELFRDKSHLGDADYSVVSEGFFKTLGIPLLQGRLFDDRDTMDAAHVALISQSLAQEKWPSESPIGRTVEFGNMDGDPRLLTVIGVVSDIRDRSLENAPRPTIYVNYRQRPQGALRFTIVLRSNGRPDAVFAAARNVLRRLDPNIPPQFRTLSQIYSASIKARRFSLTLVGIFSLTALLLAAAGIYGVMSCSVAQRTREIGVRMALGASTREVLGMVLRQGAVTSGIGISAGILGSLALTRWLQSQLFEVSPTDPVTFLSVALLLVLISMAACWIPARRATRVDPMTALRCD